MPDTEGLPGGPVLQPNLNLNVTQYQGLTSGAVSSGVKNILNTAAGGPDMNVYNAVSKSSSSTPTAPTFQANAPDPLTHIQSTLESSISADPSALGPFKAIANAIMTGMGRPVATLSDGISRMLPAWIPGSSATLAKIDQLQQNFMTNHAGDLADLSSEMGAAMSDIKGLANLLSPDSMNNFHLTTAPMQAILQQKRQVGQNLSSDLADAIANTDDPDEKARLQAEKDDVDAWQANSDKRMAQDSNQISDMQNRINKVWQAAGGQSDALMNVATGDRPGNLTSDGQIVSTTHTQPGAVNFATGVRQTLIQSRVQMNTAMAGR